jgi:UDP-GlcNAc:undecaprenyl-phosphate GlcNAc-1-phosphate transferase
MAGLAFALSGACIGFLRFNLARPARIFLGDGGSMTIGFLVAALSMATATQPDVGHAGLLVGGLLAGLPLLDVALVIMSRLRRRVKIVTGGRDHLTHRILLRLGTARRVAATLAIGQAVMGGLAIFGSKVGADAIFASSFTIVTLGITLIAVLDTARWRPAGIASGPLGSSVPSLRSERSASLQVDG